jgi:hypothetical protein
MIQVRIRMIVLRMVDQDTVLSSWGSAAARTGRRARAVTATALISAKGTIRRNACRALNRFAREGMVHCATDPRSFRFVATNCTGRQARVGTLYGSKRYVRKSWWPKSRRPKAWSIKPTERAMVAITIAQHRSSKNLKTTECTLGSLSRTLEREDNRNNASNQHTSKLIEVAGQS